MKTVAVAAVAALLFAAAAAADIPVPAGFTEAAQLEPAATWEARKPSAIYCSTTQQAFNAAELRLTGHVLGAGFTQVGTAQSFLSTWVCSYLTRWQNQKPVTRYHLAAAMLELAHEVQHQRGTLDESAADCGALAVMPQMIRRFFPLHRVYTLHDVMADAWTAHGRQGAAYLVNCPPR